MRNELWKLGMGRRQNASGARRVSDDLIHPAGRHVGASVGPWVMSPSRAWGTSFGARECALSVTHVPGLNCHLCVRTVP